MSRPVQCPACHAGCPPGARFCPACGGRLGESCPACGAPVGAETRCSQCGAGLTGAAERRQITVLFCDIVGSTALSQRLDPEDLHGVIQGYQQACAEEIEALGGHVAQYLGDGLLVYFGFPQAHEDDPVRALNAGCRIQERVPGVNAELAVRVPAFRGESLEVRVAAHTGTVVVGEVGGGVRRELLALGDALNLAARLEALAEPGWVVVSEATERLTRGVFELTDLGLQELRGIDRPIRVFRVLGPSGVDHRLELGGGLTPFVGREGELEALLASWGEVARGEGRVVLVGGEPGMGKSRLVRTLKDRLSGEPHVWLEGRCSVHHQNTAFYPLVHLLQRSLFFTPEDDAEARIGKVEAALTAVGIDADEGLPLFAPLLGVPLPERLETGPSSPEFRRRRMLAGLSAWLERFAGLQPVVLVVEDVHWVDPSTLELLTDFLDRESMPPILLLITFRPEFEPPWKLGPNARRLTLQAMPHAQVASLIEGVTGGKPLPDDVASQVVAKADGVPLFVEEVVRSLVESGLLEERAGRYERTGPARDVAIPATLQDSLMARLDRLGAAKEVAQLGSLLGREFSRELLSAVSSLPSEQLDARLEELERAGLIHCRGHGRRASYVFKHALIQDAAYQSQLRSGRRDGHRRVAKVLEESFPELAEREPEGLARHWEGAGQSDEASLYYQRAGERALQGSAHAEAVAHASRGIELLGGLPAGPERNRREWGLQRILGQVLLAARGYANPSVEKAHARLLELSAEVGDGEQLFQALGGLFIFYVTRADLEQARRIAERLRELASGSGASYFWQWARLFTGMPLFYAGRFGQAIEQFETGIELYDGAWECPAQIVADQDQGVACRCMSGQANWALGRPDRGLARTREAVRLARESGSPQNLAFALSFAALIHYERREPERALDASGELVELAEEYGFPMWLGNGYVLRGWALASGGQGERGIADIERGLGQLATTGARITGPQILGLLAQAYLAVGRPKDAVRAAESGLSMSREKALGFWDAELHRLRGEILLAQDPDAFVAADRCFGQALQVAEAQGTRAMALRAATSRARALSRLGRRAEGRALLAPLFEGFQEGHDTPDLRDAAELLAEA